MCGGGDGTGGDVVGSGGVGAPLPGGGGGCTLERGGGLAGFAGFGALPGAGDARVPRCPGNCAATLGGFPAGVALRIAAGGGPAGGGGFFSMCVFDFAPTVVGVGSAVNVTVGTSVRWSFTGDGWMRVFCNGGGGFLIGSPECQSMPRSSASAASFANTLARLGGALFAA